jgi:hypothetical protein
MMQNFQNIPAWFIIAFLVIWLFGWFFLVVKKWKQRKSSNVFPKEKMLLSLMGFAIGIILFFLTSNWLDNILLAGLSGIHAGFVAGMYFLALVFVCKTLTKAAWKFAKNK